MPSLSDISAVDFSKMNSKQALIVDVRTPMEYAEKRLALPAALAPVTELNPADVALRNGIGRDTPIYTLCASGNRARTAVAKFQEAGFTTVTVIHGGLAACQEAGMPLAGKNPYASSSGSMSLDRQVRGIVGVLILLLIPLGTFVHYSFCLLAGMLGLGLIFSAVTGWCGIALLLAKAPWNKNASCAINSKRTSPGASCQ